MSPPVRAGGLFAFGPGPRHDQAMDEIELRLAAIETALIEALGLIDPGALADAARSLRERVAQGDPEPDERAIRLGAAQLLEDAARRWAPPFG